MTERILSSCHLVILSFEILPEPQDLLLGGVELIGRVELPIANQAVAGPGELQHLRWQVAIDQLQVHILVLRDWQEVVGAVEGQQRRCNLVGVVDRRIAPVLRVGDPGRHYLPRALMTEVAALDVPTTRELEGVEVKRVRVYALD